MPHGLDRKICEIVANQMSVPPGDIGRETSFVDDLHADSLDSVDLVIRLEKAFAVKIADRDVPELQTVGDVIDCVASAFESETADAGGHRKQRGST